MPARSTRQEAPDRILKAFRAPLDRLIPAGEQVPLKGSLFVDFEDQTEALIRAASPKSQITRTTSSSALDNTGLEGVVAPRSSTTVPAYLVDLYLSQGKSGPGSVVIS